MSAPKYLILDYETRSEADLKAVGAYEYARHPSTQILCVAWRAGTKEEIRRQKTSVWSPAFGPLPRDFLDAFRLSDRIGAHNALFEQMITKYVLPRYIAILDRAFGPLAYEEKTARSWFCTAALAATVALPRKLEGAGAAVGLAHQKDMAGHRLMLKLAKPRKATKNNPARWHSKKSDLRRVMEYCVRDLDAEVELWLDHLPELNPTERAVWELDQETNQRGFQVDRPLVEKILEHVEAETARFNEEVAFITGGDVATVNQTAKLLAYVKRLGVTLPNLQAKTVRDYLKANPPTTDSCLGDARRLLELRQMGSKSSTKKYYALEARSRTDSRVRDLLVYHGASTGRWTGTGVQIQNFPRGTIHTPDTPFIAETLPSLSLDEIRLLYGEPMEVFSSVLRSCITASPGYEIFCGDYAAIEVRVLFWLAGHEKGLETYRRGQDIYREMAAVVFGVDLEDVTKEQREIGKRIILGCIAEGTKVKTWPRGDIPIEDLTYSDRLWDGEKWVRHGGLVRKGLKPVIKIEPLGLELTPDHWILTPEGWQTAEEIASDEAMLRCLSGLGTREWSVFQRNSIAERNAVSRCAAYAELKKNVASISSGEEKTFFVRSALNLLTGKEGGDPETLIFSLIENLEHVGERVSEISNIDARTLVRKTSLGTAVAAFECASKPSEIFWNTLLRLSGLTSGGSPWIELITTGTMSPETYELRLSARTTETKETFDIRDVGERNIFQAGKMLVHNCGYGMGWKKFADTCAQYDAPIDAKLAKKSVETYREYHGHVPQLWREIENLAVAATQEPGRVFHGGRTKWVVKGKYLWCELPGGRRLAYYGPKIRFDPTPWGERRATLYHWGVHPKTKKWVFDSTYGGRLVENITQATARDVMAEASLRLRRAGYYLLFSVHDELVNERAEGAGSLEEYTKIMSEVPPWARGLPLKVETWSGARYRK